MASLIYFFCRVVLIVLFRVVVQGFRHATQEGLGIAKRLQDWKLHYHTKLYHVFRMKFS